ncbi:MAG: hypothetical protein HWN66_13730, partial [Candidatus Helarchaeota archaeon]|nr:hypothetical protein [Candidatus Helarchaeota archaeon]
MKLKLKEFILENEKGGKVRLSFDGSFSPEEISKILGKLQDDDTSSEDNSQLEGSPELNSNVDYDSLSIREKLELIVKQIKHGWFT